MHTSLRAPPFTVRLLACEASLVIAMSDFQTLQADTEPTQDNVEHLLSDREHSSPDPMPPQSIPGAIL